MQALVSNSDSHLDDCLSFVNHRLVNLEARLTGPLSPLKPGSPQSEKSQTSDQSSMTNFFDSSSQKNASRGYTSSEAIPTESAKRSRSNDFSDYPFGNLKKKGSFSGSKRRQSDELSVDQENSRSIGMDIVSNPNEVSDFFKNDSCSEFIVPTLVNSLSQKIAKMQQDMKQLEGTIQELNKTIQCKDALISNYKHQLEQKDQEYKTLNEETKKIVQSAEKGKTALIRTMKQLEEKKRKELKEKLFTDSFRLGKVTMARIGAKFIETWEDGKEILETKERLNSVSSQKETLEKQKKQAKKLDEDLLATLPLKLALLTREESELKERLERLEVEKCIYVQECKRVTEEENAKYSKTTSDYEAWPVLHKRYLLLSLLGKGGYSEVYKAYDLFEHNYIAIKFHQLNPVWSEAIKANYIKHALRENQIHRELNHTRIVKHFDTLEIDNNCFCTILEYCPGEDLSMYLKKHNNLTEKETKIIMQQLFTGLKYLNDQPEKIIHYDLKPSNILLNNGEVKITDFGLSKVMDPNKTNTELTSQGAGTIWYQAPECHQRGQLPPLISSKVDVWSAGVIFYELLYGAKPFGQGMSQESVFKDQVIVNSSGVTFPSKPVVSNECKEFIRKCLEYNQDERFDVLEACCSPYLSGKK